MTLRKTKIDRSRHKEQQVGFSKYISRRRPYENSSLYCFYLILYFLDRTSIFIPSSLKSWNFFVSPINNKQEALVCWFLPLPSYRYIRIVHWVPICVYFNCFMYLILSFHVIAIWKKFNSNKIKKGIWSLTIPVPVRTNIIFYTLIMAFLKFWLCYYDVIFLIENWRTTITICIYIAITMMAKFV